MGDRVTSLGRRLLRWYLRKFPLRDGKAWVYDRWHAAFMPAARHVVVKVAHGFALRLDLNEPTQRQIYFYGTYDERHEVRLVQRLLTAGEIFWDVGANIGYFALAAAAMLHNTGEIVAFEPGAAAYKQLLENIGLNPFTRSRAFQVAVADRDGEGRLYLAGDFADGGASLFPRGIKEGPVQPCRMVSLDAFRVELGLAAPDLIKMDLEGAEPAALMGAARLLQEKAPLLLVEMKEATLTAAGRDKAAIQDFLKGLGYRPVYLHRGRWRLTEDVTEIKSRNIFWLAPNLQSHRRKAARIPVAGLEAA